MEYQEALKFIFGHTDYEAIPRLPHIMANYDLRRVEELLSRVGNPHLKAKSIHITGTNGKGSTSAMIASALTAAGYRTGLYTSPHLHTMRERMMVNWKMITEEEVARIITRLQPEIEAVDRKATYGKITVFEILTALCFVHFAEQAVDYQVMEVGLGGRFDATNVIKPEVCVITPISLDHTEVLGKTLAAIATEKSGIIKPGCTVVLSPQTDEADRVIQNICNEKGVNLIRVGQDIPFRGIAFNLESQQLEVNGRLDDYRITIPLLGQYQIENTAAAVAALEVLKDRGARLTRESLLRGLAEVEWPGRMQIVSRKPLIVIDGGHNPGASHRLREALERYSQPDTAILVIGASNDKDLAGVAAELAPFFNKVITTRAHNPRAVEPSTLAAIYSKYGMETEVTEDIPEAISRAVKAAEDKGLVCITGSLFVAAEAIEYMKR